MIDRAFWRDRPVLLTGHTGFKGSWLTLWLDRLGARVTGYALDPPTEPSLWEEAGLHELLGGGAAERDGRDADPDVDDSIDGPGPDDGAGRDHRADVRDPLALTAAFREARPEVVIHMAAQSLVRASYDEPVETWDTNVMGTVQVLEACRRSPSVRAVVVVTTDKVYEQPGGDAGATDDGTSTGARPFAESDPLGGHDPYAASKAATEIAVASWRRSFLSDDGSPAVASARAGNVIGGGDWAPDRLVPDLLAGFATGTPVEIRSPRSVRPWQHVLEPLSGYLLLAERLHAEADAPPSAARAWNFGPNEADARPVAEVADRMAALWNAEAPDGGPASWKHAGGDHPHEAATLRLEWSAARERLGWRPRWGLDEALTRTVRWHRAWLVANGPASVRAAMEADIEAYERTEVDG